MRPLYLIQSIEKVLLILQWLNKGGKYLRDFEVLALEEGKLSRVISWRHQLLGVESLEGRLGVGQ